MKKLRELKADGVKTVYLNGFKESVNYVLGVRDVFHVGETRSEDGYSMVECFETK